MPTVFQSDMHRYVPKNELRKIRRQSGKAIYLPDGKGVRNLSQYQDVEVNGDGFFDSLGNSFKGLFKGSSGPLDAIGDFVKNNKDNILTGMKMGSKAVGIASGVANLVKSAKETELIEAQKKVVEEQNRQLQELRAKAGSAIYLPEGEGISLRTPRINVGGLRTPRISDLRGYNHELLDKMAKQGEGVFEDAAKMFTSEEFKKMQKQDILSRVLSMKDMIKQMPKQGEGVFDVMSKLFSSEEFKNMRKQALIKQALLMQDVIKQMPKQGEALPLAALLPLIMASVGTPKQGEGLKVLNNP
jgi:hypothetical protein